MIILSKEMNKTNGTQKKINKRKRQKLTETARLFMVSSDCTVHKRAL